MEISVVMPAYNRASLIGESLSAILKQEYRPVEIIVVDDGSTDNTAEIAAGFGPPVRVLKTSNGGDLAARNIGLREASSQLVAFCDSDDLWEPSFLNAMIKLWVAEPCLPAAYGNFKIVRDGEWSDETKFDQAPANWWTGLRLLNDNAGIFEEPSVRRLLVFQPFFPSAMVVARENFLALGGWDETVSRIIGTDFATALRVAEGRLGILRSPLVGIRKHSTNFSGDTQAMNLGDALILEHVLASRPHLEPLRSLILDSIAARRAAAADLAFDRADFSAVCSAQQTLGPKWLTLRRRIKGLISRLPTPLALRLANLIRRKK